MAKPLFILIKIALALGLVWLMVVGIYLIGIKNAGGTFGGHSSPPNSQNEGTLIRTVTAGQITVEIRQYLAGKDANKHAFCNYWVRYNNNPVSIIEFDYQNHYNSCKALLRLTSDKPSLLLGSYADMGGAYLPIVLTDDGKELQVNLNRDCAIPAGWDESEQSINGWKIDNNTVTFCKQTWNVKSAPTT
jgi:hypothetical protein